MVRGLGLAEEERFEGDHAGGGEEQGGVAGGGQGRAGDAQMVAGDEEVGEGVADLLGLHGVVRFDCDYIAGSAVGRDAVSLAAARPPRRDARVRGAGETW